MKKILSLILLLLNLSIANAQLVIIVQAVASSVKAPNELNNVTYYHNGDSTVVSISKLKKNKLENFDSVRVNTLYSAKKVTKLYGNSLNISEIPESALYYEHTKKYRNARMSTIFAVSSWTLVLLNPYFLIVAPIPTMQAIFRDKEVDKTYVLNGKKWREFRKEYKEYKKTFKGKKNINNDETEILSAHSI